MRIAHKHVWREDYRGNVGGDENVCSCTCNAAIVIHRGRFAYRKGVYSTLRRPVLVYNASRGRKRRQ